jgi:hypothetical protein
LREGTAELSNKSKSRRSKTEKTSYPLVFKRLLGIDHDKLTYRFQGRQFRLTDAGGSVVKEVIT